MHHEKHTAHYHCLFTSCEEGLPFFNTEDEWIQHEKIHHRTQDRWTCKYCQGLWDERVQLEAHLREVHREQIGDAQSMKDLVDSARKTTSRPVQHEPCPFCEVCNMGSFESWKSWSAHVGTHFREMTKYALSQFIPRNSNLEVHVRNSLDGALAFDGEPLEVIVHDSSGQETGRRAVLDTAGYNAITRSCADALGLEKYPLPQDCTTFESMDGLEFKSSHFVKLRWRHKGLEHADEAFIIVKSFPRGYVDVDITIGKDIIAKAGCLILCENGDVRFVPSFLIFHKGQSLCPRPI